MRKTVLAKEFADTLIARAEQLDDACVALWGTMTVTEMLHHCNVTNQQVLSWEGTVRPATLWQRIVKWFNLYLMPRFPKNVKGPKRYDMKGKVDQARFAEERNQYIAYLRKFPHLRKPMYSPHPFFGPLSTKEWGMVIYKHLDHHLRQFGV
ncbi:MAG: DUF1569 domain-containing protein [Lunatimonas sp.]|uniref:DUF1569 domain-containing protein n=1 Tax=Lunatimonas sp. TaxID=2060141 RepID=UPI00263B1990|nr:DUF1569 domain-containing protein [Lunatimonas sp.]MCC5936582.1 DUF1569 domain-containing protein [Lunatimonas sp.]